MESWHDVKAGTVNQLCATAGASKGITTEKGCTTVDLFFGSPYKINFGKI
jgi:hypothetical protein